MTGNKNAVQVFGFESRDVRVIMKGDEPWFVAKDVCEVLGYENSRKAIADHIDADERGVTKCDTLGGVQELSIINESGLYALILRSHKPEAKRFRKWVTSEVLPTIRKHSAYITPEALKKAMTDPTFAYDLLEALKTSQEKNAALTAKIQEDAHKVTFYDTVTETDDHISVSTAAKVLNYKNIGPLTLFAFLKEKKVLMSNRDQYNVPYQKYIDKGFFRFAERSYTDWRGETHVHYRPWVSQKGLDFINGLLMKAGYAPQPVKRSEK